MGQNSATPVPAGTSNERGALKKWQLLELFAYFLSEFFDGFSE